MSHPNKKRLRRSMMFLNCQKPGLIKDPYIYKPDSIMLDLEDAVAENQKDAARYSLYHALQEIDYRGVERVVRINGLDTPHWKEDIRVCVAGGADTIRIAKTESAQDVHTVEEHVLAAEREFGRPEGSTLLMAALESCKGVLNALEVCKSSDRLIGIALSGGDYTKDLQTVITGTGVELQGLDFRFQREPEESEINQIEQQVNRIIQRGLPITTEYITQEEALGRFDLRRLPDNASETVRVVKVGDYDECLCIGRHVENTSEIGVFKIISYDFKDGILRLRFKLL